MAPSRKPTKNKAAPSGIKKIRKRKRGKCYNCKSTVAYNFYPCKDGTGNKECATCYEYSRLHPGAARDPDRKKNRERGLKIRAETLARIQAEREARGEVIEVQCANCHRNKVYKRKMTGVSAVCRNCSNYLKRNGKPRPPELEEERKELMKMSNKQKKFRCDNCTATQTPCWFRGVDGYNRVCKNCDWYFHKNGKHRPPELEERRMEKLKAVGEKTDNKRVEEPESDGDSGAGQKGRKPKRGAGTVYSDSDDGGRSESSEGTDSGSDDENSEPQRPGPSNAKRPPPRRRRMTLNSESDEDGAAVKTPTKKQAMPAERNEIESDIPEYDYDCPGPSNARRNVASNPQPPRRRMATFNLDSDVNPKKKKAEVVMRNPIKSDSDELEDDGGCPGPSQRPGPSNSKKRRDVVRSVESSSGEESDEVLNELMSTLSTLTDEQKRIVVKELTKKTPVEENQRAADEEGSDPDEFVETDGEDSDSFPTKLTAEQRRNIMRKLTETDSENESDEEGSDSRRKVSKDRTAPMDLDEEVVPRKMVKRSEESEGSRQTKKLAMKRTRGADSDGSEDREEATGTVNREMKLTRTRARKPPAKRRAAEANEPENEEPSDDRYAKSKEDQNEDIFFRRLKKTNRAALTEPDNLFVTYFEGDLQHVEVLKRVRIEVPLDGIREAEDREDVEDCNHLVGMGPIFERNPLDAYEGAMIGKEDPEVEPGNADDQEDDEEEIQEAAEAGNQAEESDDEEVAEDPEVMPDAADNQEQAIIEEDLDMDQSHEGNFDDNQEPRSMPLEDRREEVNTDEAEEAEEVDDEEDDDVIWVEDVLRATTPVKDEEVPQDGEGPVEAREDQEDDEDQAVEEEVITDEAQDQAEEVDDEEDDDVIWLEDVLCAQIEVPQDGEGEDQKDADGIEEDPEAVEDQEHAEPVTEPIAEDQIPDVKDEDQEHDERIPASGDVADEAGKNQEAMNPEGLQNVSEAEPSDDPVAREDQDPIPEIVAEEAAEDHEDDEDQVAEEVPRDPEDQTVEPKAEVEEEQDEVPPGDRRVRRSNEVVNDQEMKEEAADDQERDEEEAGEDQEDQNEADPEKELQNEPEAEPEPADDQMEVMEGEDLERDETMLIGGADKEEENPVEAMPVFKKKYAFYMGIRYSFSEFFDFINQMCLRFPAHLMFSNKEEEKLERVFIFYKDWNQNMKKMVAKSTWLSEEVISKWLIERKEYEEPDGNVEKEDVFWVKMRKLYNFLDGELPVKIHKQIAFWVKVTVATLRKTLNLPEPEGGSEVESEDEMDEVDGQNQERDQEGMQAEPEAEPGAEPETENDQMEAVEDEDQESDEEDAGGDHEEADPEEEMQTEPAAEPAADPAADPVAPEDQMQAVEDEDQDPILARGPVEAREDQEDYEDQVADEAEDQAEDVDDEEDDDVIWVEDVPCATMPVKVEKEVKGVQNEPAVEPEVEPETDPVAPEDQIPAVEDEDQDLILAEQPVAEEAAQDEEDDQEGTDPEAAENQMDAVEDEDQGLDESMPIRGPIAEEAAKDGEEEDQEEVVPEEERRTEPEAEPGAEPEPADDQMEVMEREDLERDETMLIGLADKEEARPDCEEEDQDEVDLEKELHTDPENEPETADVQMVAVEDEDQGRNEPMPIGGLVAEEADPEEVQNEPAADPVAPEDQIPAVEDDNQERDDLIPAGGPVGGEDQEDKLQEVPDAEAEVEPETDPVASEVQVPAVEDEDQEPIPAGEPVAEKAAKDPPVEAEIQNEEVNSNAPLSQPTPVDQDMWNSFHTIHRVGRFEISSTGLKVKTTPVHPSVNLPIVPDEEKLDLPIWSSPAFNPQINQFFFYPNVVGSMTDFFNRVMRIRTNLPDNLILVNQNEKLLEREFVWIQDFDKYPNFKKKLAEATLLIEQGLTTWFNERTEFEVIAEPIDIEKMDFVTKMEKLLHFFNGFVPESIYANIANWAETNFLHVKYYLEARKSMKLKALAF